MIDENLGVPFETTVLGVDVTVEGVDLSRKRADCRSLHARAQGQMLPLYSIFRCPRRRRTARNGSRHTAGGVNKNDRHGGEGS